MIDCPTMLRRLLLSAAIWAAAGPAGARGVSPYLPLSLAPEIERQIERLLILADVPVMTRPLTAATVLDALRPEVCDRDAALCDEVERYLSSYMRAAGLTHASLAAAGGSTPATALANRHGMPSDSAYEFSARGHWQAGNNVLISLGLAAYEDESTPTGSVISAGFEYLQVDIGFRDHWLSPLTDSAMLIATEAETMPSITVSNYTPLTRAGLRYELFVAEMGWSDRIRTETGLTAGHPRLAGIHLSIEPLPGWSLGFNRLMQFGGGARGGDSLSDWFDAFFDPARIDNTGTPADFGNQAASITSRLVIPGKNPFAVYAEYAGEDTSRSTDWRLGNAALGFGVHVPALRPNLDWRFEFNEWQNGWYVHGIYQDGLRHEGRVIGHWGADRRVVGDGVGAQSLMMQFGWQPQAGGLLQIAYRTLRNEDTSATAYRRAQDLQLLYSRSLGDWRVGAEINAGRDVFGESYSRVAVFVRF